MTLPKFILQTCDLYKNVLEANKYGMDKNGCSNIDMTVLGYSKPDFDLGNWKFISMGTDRGPQNFTNDIKPFFDSFNDEYFIFVNDDIVLTEPFNFEFLEEVLETVKLMPNFGRMWLGESPPQQYGGYKVKKDFGGYQLGEIPQHGTYRLSLQISLWKTEYFKRYITPNINPWQWEMRPDAKNDGANILLPVNNYVVNFAHIFKKCKLKNNWFKSVYGKTALNDEEIKIVSDILKKHNIYNMNNNLSFDKGFNSKVEIK